MIQRLRARLGLSDAAQGKAQDPYAYEFAQFSTVHVSASMVSDNEEAVAEDPSSLKTPMPPTASPSESAEEGPPPGKRRQSSALLLSTAHH